MLKISYTIYLGLCLAIQVQFTAYNCQKLLNPSIFGFKVIHLLVINDSKKCAVISAGSFSHEQSSCVCIVWQFRMAMTITTRTPTPGKSSLSVPDSFAS